MKAISATILALMVTVTQALATAGAPKEEGMGLLATLFISFAIFVVLFQFLPGITLFLAMLKGIFGSAAAKRSEEAVSTNRTNP